MMYDVWVAVRKFDEISTRVQGVLEQKKKSIQQRKEMKALGEKLREKDKDKRLYVYVCMCVCLYVFVNYL